MKTLSTSDLESRLFKILTACYPEIQGHVVSVHRDRWLAFYMYAPIYTPQDCFDEMVALADGTLKAIWPEPTCAHKHNVGISNGQHFYTLWLPVPPACRSSDFSNFFLAA